MKKLLIILFLAFSFHLSAQTPQTNYVAASIATMKSYFGNANRIYVTATNEDYILCSSCTADEITIYAGASGRKWKKLSDIAKLNISDTTNKWLTSIRRRGDSVFSIKGGTETFAYKDSTGGSGGGSGVTKAQAPFVIKGSDSISRRWNVLDYVGSGYVMGVTDATAAFNNAAIACDAGGGGIVFVPNGRYIIAGSLLASNSQIAIPLRLGTSALRNHIRLIGESRPANDPAGFGLATDAVTPVATGMVTLVSTRSTYTAGSFVIGSEAGNTTSFDVENIAIEVKNNPAGTGPVIGGISFKNNSGASADYVAVYVDTSGYRSTYPVNDVTGIEMPDNNLGQDYSINHSIVVGFRNGYKTGEHVTFNNAVAVCNYYAVYMKDGFHSTASLRVGSYWNAYDIYVGGFCTLSNFHIDIEWQQIGKWYDNIATIKDTANLASGTVYYTIIRAVAGKDNSKFIKTGGAYLNTYTNDTKLAAEGNVNNFTASNTFNDTTYIKKGIVLGQTAAGAANNLIALGGTGAVDNTLSIIGNGLSGGANTTYGPYAILRGNSYTAGANQRGSIYLGAGSPSSPTSTEGLVGIYTAGTQALIIDKNHHSIFNTPATADANATVLIAPVDNTQKGLVIQGQASQTGVPFQIQNSDGTIRQSLTQNGNTTLHIMHAGAAGTEAAMVFYDGPDGGNAAYAAFGVSTSGGYFGTTGKVFISSSKNGSGTALPIEFGGYSGGWTTYMRLNTDGTIRMPAYGAGTATFDASGNITSVAGTPVTLTATQTLTNKTLTSPVINTPTGIVKADISDLQTALDLKAPYPKYAIVSGSNVTTTSATAVDITGLSIAVGANKTYRVTAVIITGCDNTGGIRFAMTGPSGAAVVQGVFAGSSTANAAAQQTRLQALGTLTTTAVGFNRFSGQGAPVTLIGYITTSSTTGNIVMQVASQTAGQTSTIYIGSMMDLQEVQL